MWNHTHLGFGALFCAVLHWKNVKINSIRAVAHLYQHLYLSSFQRIRIISYIFWRIEWRTRLAHTNVITAFCLCTFWSMFLSSPYTVSASIVVSKINAFMQTSMKIVTQTQRTYVHILPQYSLNCKQIQVNYHGSYTHLMSLIISVHIFLIWLFIFGLYVIWTHQFCNLLAWCVYTIFEPFTAKALNTADEKNDWNILSVTNAQLVLPYSKHVREKMLT